jgi:exodeoxyribonuclease V gamma subunit
VIRELYPIVEAVLAAVQSVIPEEAEPAPIDVHAQLPDGRVLSGTVPSVYGDVVLQSTFSRVSGKHRLASWVRVLAATASHPERPFSAATVGRTAARGTVTIARIESLGADTESRRRVALDQLAVLADLYDRGMREPLPLYCLSSHAYAEAAATGRDAVAAARRAWTSDWNFDKEDRELEHQLMLGGVRRFDELLEDPPRGDEQGPGWEMAETTRFGRYARRLSAGLLGWEEVTTR